MNVFETVMDELNKEAAAILEATRQLDAKSVERAFQLLSECQGKIVVTGMGKTGIIARKISATLASTGSTSIFLHAAEGIHGDLGMISKDDVVIAVSNSGSTQEIISLIPYIKFLQVPLIALTGNPDSQLAINAEVVLNCHVSNELEPLGLVPTASTTVALAVGDALAIALMRNRDFQLSDFARFHPGGSIGKKLLLKVRDLMHHDDALPVVCEQAPMEEVIMMMTSKKLGCTAVTDDQGKLCGMITDGDLRRQLHSKGNTLLNFSAKDCMSPHPKYINPEELAVNVLNLMENHKITMIPVVDAELHPVGMLHMHDLIQAGII